VIVHLQEGILQDTLLEHFSQLSDPRIDRTKAHLLLDIIAIAVLAVLAEPMDGSD